MLAVYTWHHDEQELRGFTLSTRTVESGKVGIGCIVLKLAHAREKVQQSGYTADAWAVLTICMMLLPQALHHNKVTPWRRV